ncbi:MAG: bifunctional demethylmenaquinone methyltransferase/2-methoxy-6-polyprenyl-1,4-benzoquinol methylase UbiE [Hyphomicrobium sp.]
MTTSTMYSNNYTFGFRQIPEEIRQQLVNQVFTKVAGRYDLMNDLMSGGLHRIWKSTLIGMLNLSCNNTPYKILDVASGTGDIALRSLTASKSNVSLVLNDINSKMLNISMHRPEMEAFAKRASFVQSNAEELPFLDKSFDAYTIAFGIRNVTHIDKALKEAYRVLKIGGRFLCLEFSEVQVPILDKLYDFHSFKVIPQLAKLTVGEEDPYKYLVESIRQFPNQVAFSKMISDVGLSNIRVVNLSGGIAAIHSGWRL